jgi:hypothetical protein
MISVLRTSCDYFALHESFSRNLLTPGGEAAHSHTCIHLFGLTTFGFTLIAHFKRTSPLLLSHPPSHLLYTVLSPFDYFATLLFSHPASH